MTVVCKGAGDLGTRLFVQKTCHCWQSHKSVDVRCTRPSAAFRIVH